MVGHYSMSWMSFDTHTHTHTYKPWVISFKCIPHTHKHLLMTMKKKNLNEEKKIKLIAFPLGIISFLFTISYMLCFYVSGYTEWWSITIIWFLLRRLSLLLLLWHTRSINPIGFFFESLLLLLLLLRCVNRYPHHVWMKKNRPKQKIFFFFISSNFVSIYHDDDDVYI